MLCCVMCEQKKKNVDNKKRICKVKNIKESMHIVRRIAPLDETGLVLFDQTMNYLLHTRSKHFSIDFQITWDKRNRSVAGTI